MRKLATLRRTRIKNHFVIVACWWSIYRRSSAWVESLALLTSLRCDSTQADRVVRPIRIRCKLWGGEGYCESKAHDYDYSWPGLEPKSLDPESRTAGKLAPAPQPIRRKKGLGYPDFTVLPRNVRVYIEISLARDILPYSHWLYCSRCFWFEKRSKLLRQHYTRLGKFFEYFFWKALKLFLRQLKQRPRQKTPVTLTERRRPFFGTGLWWTDLWIHSGLKTSTPY